MVITTEGFIRVEIDADMLERAKNKAKEMGILRNSIRKGAGNIVGFLGEEMVLASFPGSISQNTFQHDILFGESTLEVKSKDRTVNPKLDYEASVADFNTRQNADFLVFCSIFRNKTTQEYTHGHIVGMFGKSLYIEAATFLRVGDVDPSNGWTVRADCYNLPYSELTRFEELR